MAAELLQNAGADKAVYGDHQELVNALLESHKMEKKGEDTPVKQKDFYWDRIALILVSAILALSFLDISIEFFRGSQVQCYFEIDNFTVAKAAYINSFCYGSLPDSQYYLIFIFISALVIIAPHYLWDAYFAANFNFFFDVVKKLDRLRDRSTGEYHPKNFDRVKKLEEKFGKSTIFKLYKVKLVLQLAITLGVVIINAIYFKRGDFIQEFMCPKDCVPADGNASANSAIPNCTEIWPLDTQVECVFSSLKLLGFLHDTAFALLGLTFIVLVIGLVWICGRHAAELGAKEIAEFSFTSCLPPKSFAFPSWTTLITSKDVDTQFTQSLDKASRPTAPTKKANSKSYVYPRIQNDLDFLLMRLFRADSGHGQVFKDIQVAKHLKMLISEDHQRLYLLKKTNQDWIFRLDENDNNELQVKQLKEYYFRPDSKFGDPEEEIYLSHMPHMGPKWAPKPSIKDVLYQFMMRKPNEGLIQKKRLAMAISFGTAPGYSLVLARAFDEVATIHFNHFYKNQVSRVEKYRNSYKAFTLCEDFYSQTASEIDQFETLIGEIFELRGNGGIDLLLIGPVGTESQLVTTNLMIEMMYHLQWFSKGAVLLAIRPLWIGSRNTLAHYKPLQPNKDLFERLGKEEEFNLHKFESRRFHVTRGKKQAVSTSKNSQNDKDKNKDEEDKAEGVFVKCNDVDCIFEFRLFHYIGTEYA